MNQEEFDQLKDILERGSKGGIWLFEDECQVLHAIISNVTVDDACPRCGGETDIPGGICADCDANMLRSDMGV